MVQKFIAMRTLIYVEIEAFEDEIVSVGEFSRNAFYF